MRLIRKTIVIIRGFVILFFNVNFCIFVKDIYNYILLVIIKKKKKYNKIKSLVIGDGWIIYVCIMVILEIYCFIY